MRPVYHHQPESELGLELELSGWAPWRVPERGTEWILTSKSELLEFLSGVRRLPLKEAKTLSEEHKAVLPGSYRRIPGLSTFCTGTRIKIWRKVAFDSRLILQAKAGIEKSPGWSKGQYRVQIGQSAHSSVEMF